jgi:carbon-monoxide dehydrogenase medium subunit
MKPPALDYLRADTVADAVEILALHGDVAKVLAGGQSLVPLLNLRFARPDVLVDVNRLHDLAAIEVRTGSPNELVVGALTRHRDLEQSPLVGQLCPVLREGTHHIGHFQIRNRGTVGGSIAHADPAAELPLVATLLDASIDIGSSDGNRTVAASDFFKGYWTTTLEPNELVTHLRFPLVPPGSPWYFREFARRSGDFAILAVAAVRPRLGPDHFAPIRLAVSGLADRSLVLGSAAQLPLDEHQFGANVIDTARRSDEIPDLDNVRRQMLCVLLDDAARALRAPHRTPSRNGH